MVVANNEMLGIISPADVGRAVALHGLGAPFGTAGSGIVETTAS